jgi:hypothetical protein
MARRAEADHLAGAELLEGVRVGHRHAALPAPQDVLNGAELYDEVLKTGNMSRRRPSRWRMALSLSKGQIDSHYNTRLRPIGPATGICGSDHVIRVPARAAEASPSLTSGRPETRRPQRQTRTGRNAYFLFSSAGQLITSVIAALG